MVAKFSYLLYDRSVTLIKQRHYYKHKDFNDSLYGLFVRHTINLYAYYGLNPFLNRQRLTVKRFDPVWDHSFYIL
jgi:hypothetical protein